MGELRKNLVDWGREGSRRGRFQELPALRRQRGRERRNRSPWRPWRPWLPARRGRGGRPCFLRETLSAGALHSRVKQHRRRLVLRCLMLRRDLFRSLGLQASRVLRCRGRRRRRLFDELLQQSLLHLRRTRRRRARRRRCARRDCRARRDRYARLDRRQRLRRWGSAGGLWQRLEPRARPRQVRRRGHVRRRRHGRRRRRPMVYRRPIGRQRVLCGSDARDACAHLR